jgi:quercetin dioxygenase-like cupin family protein
VIVIYGGRGVYTVGETELIAEPEDVVIVPPNTWHHVAVFDSGRVDIELAPTT